MNVVNIKYFIDSGVNIFPYVNYVVIVFPLISLLVVLLVQENVLKSYAILASLTQLILIFIFIIFYLYIQKSFRESLYGDFVTLLNPLLEYSYYNEFKPLAFPLINSFLGFELKYYVDELGLVFVVLTVFLIHLCIYYNIELNVFFLKFNLILLFLLEIFLLNCFFVSDLFWFYFFFESTLIPMFFIIGIWGSRERKRHAGYQFFLYTLVGSILLLLSLLLLKSTLGTTNFEHLRLLICNCKLIPQKITILLWLFFFFSFACKIPIFPFHIWLPEAHVEAPTAGSVLLAGILLKLGSYGILRILFSCFFDINIYCSPIIIVLCLISIIYSSCTILRQTDIKKIIAYSSIIHMNFGLFGLFLYDNVPVVGAILAMISHGFVSGALFFCIGMLYDRYHTRNILYYGGLVQVMPIFSFFFFFFIISNTGFPGTSSFISELAIIIGLVKENIILMILSSIGLLFSTIFSFSLFNRIIFGSLKSINLYGFKDIEIKEILILSSLAVVILIFGLKVANITNWLSNFIDELKSVTIPIESYTNFVIY